MFLKVSDIALLGAKFIFFNFCEQLYIEQTFGGTEFEDGLKWKIHFTKAFRLTLFRGNRQNEE